MPLALLAKSRTRYGADASLVQQLFAIQKVWSDTSLLRFGQGTSKLALEDSGALPPELDEERKQVLRGLGAAFGRWLSQPAAL